MKTTKFNFEDLQVYQKSLDFVDMVYDTTDEFPKEEIYRLSSQYIRAAISIPLNIAEGSGDTDAQFNRYLQISGNSVKESVVCSTIARRRKYITEAKDEATREKLAELSKMSNGLQKYLKNKK